MVPAFNEERAIPATIDGVPAWVDRIIVIDDASRDGTFAAAEASARPGLEVLRHEANRGVGAAIVTGYRRAFGLEGAVDIAAVMAGDGQMDPGDLARLLDPVVDGSAGYAKGNRFLDRSVWREMPWTRVVGNVVLSLATRAVSGYWHVFDSQCGYTAIARATLDALEVDKVFPRYGYPNDLLARLHAAGIRVVDVAVRPIYGPSWKSGIRLRTVVHPIPWLLARAWARRVRAEWLRPRPALPDPATEISQLGEP